MHTITGSSVRLPSGEELTFRQARSEDAPAVREFLESLSEESRLMRYHSPVPVVRWWMVEAVTASDHDRREALLALSGGKVVGLAEWGKEPGEDGRAHVAIVVDDGVRRKGIARALTRRLGAVARQHGISEFVATVMTVNHPVLGLIDKVAPERATRFDGDAVEVVIPLRPRELAVGA